LTTSTARFLTLSLLLLLVSACVIVVYFPTTAFLVWFAADNDLEGYVEGDLKEMSYPAPWLDVVVAIDYHKKEDVLMRIVENERIVLEKFEQINSGDPEQLRNFLEEYRRSNTVLVIWNHGDWWRGESLQRVSTKGVAYDSDGDPNYFYFKDFLTINEIKGVLKDNPVTVLAFDACIMGTFEILWELKDCAKYIVASSKEIPGTGYDYSFLRVSSSVSNLLRKMVEYYGKRYGSDYSLSVWDTSKLKPIMDTLNEIANYKEKLSLYAYNVERRKSNGKDTEMVELGSLAWALMNSGDEGLKTLGEKLLNSIKSARVYGTPSDYTDLLIYLPRLQNSQDWSFWNDFKALEDFCDDSSWDELLESLKGASR